MQITQKITPAILAAATGMLQPYIPDLSPQGLIAALKTYEAANTRRDATTKPLTRQEAAALLSVSVNTINRYMNLGYLRRVKISDRLVRIDPCSVQALLENGIRG